MLKTGAYWRGPIGDAVIEVHLKNTFPDQVTSVTPDGWERNGNTISWHLKNFDPDEDIEILIMQDTAYQRREEVKRLLAEDPDNAQAYFLMGTVLNGSDPHGMRSPDALRAFERAVELDPEHWDARWFLGRYVP